MPQLIDKLLLNQGGLRSFWLIIKGWFRGIVLVMGDSQTLADEIEGKGWSSEAEAQEFLRSQEADCATVDKACRQFIRALDKFHANQMKRNEDMRVWIDKKRAQQSQKS